ncbi:YafY family transcriptional regulator [Nocardia sp. CA2R105]|uniref:helix-turn-helix transcriptional regulator n=1 Tax=Nocardia coffeae TaxID=2873381 RepID=UPI001CA64C4D|nr:YafY family protein [Nocardia coffeae]MBY8861033.1 YafY family transcriptional regulator [Nocardia coffeae]
MANTSTRTLRLLSLLQTHKYWPGFELAERLEVSARTLRRDVDRLRALGYPVEARRGSDGGYQLAAGAALPPLMVDDEEAVALVVGLQAATGTTAPGVAEASVRALAKLVQVMPPRLRRRVQAVRAMTIAGGWSGQPGPAVDTGVLTTIALACRDTERLRFGYTAADGRGTDRYVEPHRLVSLGRRWYFVAYDLTRHDWRSFRVDRVVDPETDGSRFLPRDLPAADAAEFVRSGMDNLPGVHRVEALVHASADTIRERIGRWCTIEELDAEHCRISITADSLDWATMALGVVDAEFRILHPPELIAHVQNWADRFQRASSADVTEGQVRSPGRSATPGTTRPADSV